MKKYRVTVNGTVYEVELEELTGSAPVSAPAAPAAAPAPAASAAPAPCQRAATVGWRSTRTCRVCRTGCR